MYILNKEELKKQFDDYNCLAVALDYNNDSVFRDDRGGKILDDNTVLCPENLKKKFDEKGYSDIYYTVDERILINAMIYGKFVLANDVMRVVVGLMLEGFTRKPPKIYWTLEELVEASEYRIYKKSVENLLTIGEGSAYFQSQNGKYSLNVKALTQSCQ